ncbi:hypothetical protein ACNO8X_04880 [Mycobacterium sp. PDNC021]|uniref:hypothetical protein n=1 Tax=Mycobacterium sp. PDNC021 TaxID=3391399 RepID=UPI003AAD6D12
MKRNEQAAVRPEDALHADLAHTGTDGRLPIPGLLSRGEKAVQEAKRHAQNAVLISFDEKGEPS